MRQVKSSKVLVSALVLLGVTDIARAQATPTFNRDVRPILSNNCFECHGPSDADREAGLRLDVPDGETGALTPRDEGFVLKPGDVEASALWRRISSEDDGERMPPPESHKAPLGEQDLQVIRRWIEDGAAYEPFWSFIPPVKSPAPAVTNAAWGQGLIDSHVMARLEQEGLQPTNEADRRTLLRRVTFDLTGLPPTLEEIDAFLADDRPGAYERLVDDLLTRPSYGEHMTRYWADLVRLADTNGMHKDFHRDFTTYRDWLIRSFNNNMPFDEFLTYQLAGDLMENPSQDQLVASGFNRLHLIIDVGTALPEESLHKNVVDRVEAFGTVFLAMTVQCAQCHDHKYDPISQKEYFQLYGFFNNFSGEPETRRRPERGLQPPFIHLTTADQQARVDEFETQKDRLARIRDAAREQIEASDKQLGAFEATSVPWIWADDGKKSSAAEFRALLTIDEAPTRAVVRFAGMTTAEVQINGTVLGRSFGWERGIAADVTETLVRGDNLIKASAGGDPGFALILEYETGGESHVFTTGDVWETRASDDGSWTNAREVHTPHYRNEWTGNATPANIASLTRDLELVESELKNYLSTIPAAMVMREREPPRQARMLHRGMYDAPGEPVERGTPAILPPMPEKEGPYTRLDLANWLVDPKHPLTARVAVNRFWQQFFGVGLVKTSEDFGAQGEWPSHPELLDNLAIRFVESGWDVKELVRTIVLSNTYKQSSDATPEEYRRDPENRLLARGSRFRMDAEMIRDQILAVSGLLNTTMYGPSVKPPQPPGLWEMVSMAEPKTYVADTGDSIYRRSLYTYWRRGMPPPQMTIMNAPSREYCVARRERTNTPLQALLLMNEQQYFNAAKACAQNTLPDDSDVEAGLRLLYEKITTHEPSANRLELMKATLREFRDIYGSDRALTRRLTPEMDGASIDERVELASWTLLAHSLLNLELTKVRR